MSLQKIVSGGQTGVDRAALDAAMAGGLEVGGWCPSGRRAEDGRIPDRYPLRETAGADYAERTRLNVRDSDATLIVAPLPLAGGTRLTREFANELGRPCLVIDPGDGEAVARAAAWLAHEAIAVLNVAGPRGDAAGQIYERARRVMTALLEAASG